MYPELTWEVSNWQPEHKSCSDASGQSVVIAKAKATALAEAGFSLSSNPPESPPLPFSPPEGSEQTNLDLLEANGMLPIPGLRPDFTNADQPTIRPGLDWDPDYLLGFDWLAEFAVVPEDASPPLYMSPVPDEAVGSYGPELVAWAEDDLGIRLRWWQRLAVTRQFEHRADGSLCHRKIVESGPRRIGKSVRMRTTALWRMKFGLEMFGETQLVMHTGSDIPICREIQRGAWIWAAEQGWEVTRANGKESIETLSGSRWLVRSQDGVYGYDVCLGMVDEGWDVKPDTVTEGLEPATLERSSPQLHLTSTAHSRATSLMRSAIRDALTLEDQTVLLLVWAAPPGADYSDPAVWRAASPHWSKDRADMVSAKYEAALVGKADPQADDPDPVGSFTAQYLNVWRLDVGREAPGDPITTPETWRSLVNDVEYDLEDLNLVGGGIESWFGQGVALGLAWTTPDGTLLGEVTDHPSLEAARDALLAVDSSCKVTVGTSLAEDPVMRPLGRRMVKGSGRAANAAADLARLIHEEAFTHDGGEFLAAQVLGMRTKPSADGPRIVSKGRADAIKALVWALAQARVKRPRITRLVTPSLTNSVHN